jgi:hypothetical protein
VCHAPSLRAVLVSAARQGRCASLRDGLAASLDGGRMKRSGSSRVRASCWLASRGEATPPVPPSPTRSFGRPKRPLRGGQRFLVGRIQTYDPADFQLKRGSQQLAGASGVRGAGWRSRAGSRPPRSPARSGCPGEPTAAAEVLGLVVLVAAGGRVGLLTRRAEDVFWVGVPEVGHGPVPLVEGWWPAPTRCAAVRSDAGRPLNRDGPGQLLPAGRRGILG